MTTNDAQRPTTRRPTTLRPTAASWQGSSGGGSAGQQRQCRAARDGGGGSAGQQQQRHRGGAEPVLGSSLLDLSWCTFLDLLVFVKISQKYTCFQDQLRSAKECLTPY